MNTSYAETEPLRAEIDTMAGPVLLEFGTRRLAGPVAEVLLPSGDKCFGKLSPPDLAQPLLHAGQHPALLLFDVMLDRLDQLVERFVEFGRVGIHIRHLFEHVLGLGMLVLAVCDFLGLASLVLGDRVYL